MRALPDANILTSYLLPTARPIGTIRRIIDAGLARRYTLLLPERVVVETLDAVATSPYLSSRVDSAVAGRFAESLRTAAEGLPPITPPFPAISRDKNDDYLLAQAAAGRANYPVTGDKDLLVLAGNPFPFHIVSPADFLAILEAAGLA